MIGPPDFNPSDQSSEVIEKCRDQFAAGDPSDALSKGLESPCPKRHFSGIPPTS
jgi:hypothetical protein